MACTIAIFLNFQYFQFLNIGRLICSTSLKDELEQKLNWRNVMNNIENKLVDGDMLSNESMTKELNDIFEQEADFVAAVIMQMSESASSHVKELFLLRGGGQLHPKSIRTFFESRFAHDFSQVRIHTDARSAELAQTLNARISFGFQNQNILLETIEFFDHYERLLK